MAGVTGLEPATSGVTGQRSNRTELHPLLGPQDVRFPAVEVKTLGVRRRPLGGHTASGAEVRLRLPSNLLWTH